MTLPIIQLVDDNVEILQYLKAILRLNGFASCEHSSSRAALPSLSAIKDGCVIVDYNMPFMDGLQLIREMRALGSQLPFILMSGCATIPLVVDGMKLGAVTVLEKPIDTKSFLANVQLAIHSQRIPAPAESLLPLTMREKEVLKLVVGGALTKNIAKTLGVSPKTVEVHRSNIKKKFGVASTAQLVGKVFAMTEDRLNSVRLSQI